MSHSRHGAHPRTLLQALLVLCVALWPALAGARALQDASGADAKAAEYLAKVKAEGDRVPELVLSDLGGLRTRKALDALLESYDVFQTVFMKREVIRALRLFDGVPECEQKALQRIMDEATASEERELREAAVEALGNCSVGGKPFLRLIVTSPAEDAVRERALAAHIRLATDDDLAWYRELWKPKKAEDGDDKKPKPKVRKAPKKGEKEAEEEAKPRVGIILNSMRLTAFEALAPKLATDELVEAATREGFARIRKAALEELAQRGDKKVLELAWDVFKDDGEFPENRLVAARIVAAQEGVKCAPEFTKRLNVSTPVELRRGLGEILVGLNDPGINKELVEQIGRGKDWEKLFHMHAVRALQDERVDKALVKLLGDKEVDVVVTAAKILGERRYPPAGEALLKLFEKSKDREVRRAALWAVAQVRVGDKAWVEELVALTKSTDPEVRNLALMQLGQTADRTHLERMVAALSDADWSTRLAALEALEKMRTKEAVDAMVARMGQEDGRMRVEFSRALWRLTGQPFQEDAKAWESWWAQSKDRFQLLSDVDLEKVRSGEEEWRLRQTTRVKTEFFGIKIVSHRVIFVIDVSGSMEEHLANDYKGKAGWTRMEVAKSELKKCLENLDPGAFFNLVVFSTGVERWNEGALAPCDDKHRADSLAFADKLMAGGGTNLYGALKDAFEDKEVDTIFVLSDGEPSVGDVTEPVVIREQVAAWNQSRGIVVNTIAVGGQFDILEWLAADSGGTHVKFE